MEGKSRPRRPDPKITIGLLKELIRIPSVNPSIEDKYDEAAIADFIARWFRKKKLFHVVEQTVKGNRFNVITTLDGKGGGRSLMLNGHMDTVGVSYLQGDPFKPITKAGRIYGRGSCDMKGSLAAMMSTMLALATSKEPLMGDLTLAAVVDEEFESKGTTELVKRFRSDSAIVGEPTDLNIAIAHKGYIWLEVEITGREAHGSIPEKGIDAIEKSGRFMTELVSLRKQYKHIRHELVGTPNIHTSRIRGGTEWSTIPGKCILQLERRLIPHERPAHAIRELQNVIRGLAARDPTFRAKVRYVHHADPMEVPANSPIVRILRENVRRMSRRGSLIGAPYWTDAAILTNQAKIPSCLFGPGNVTEAHSDHESVKLSDVTTAAEIYTSTTQQFSRTSPLRYENR